MHPSKLFLFPDVVLTINKDSRKVQAHLRPEKTVQNLTVPHELFLSGIEPNPLTRSNNSQRKSTHLCVENESGFIIEKKKYSLPSAFDK